jgi:hypothetical protein
MKQWVGGSGAARSNASRWTSTYVKYSLGEIVGKMGNNLAGAAHWKEGGTKEAPVVAAPVDVEGEAPAAGAEKKGKRIATFLINSRIFIQGVDKSICSTATARRTRRMLTTGKMMRLSRISIERLNDSGVVINSLSRLFVGPNAAERNCLPRQQPSDDVTCDGDLGSAVCRRWGRDDDGRRGCRGFCLRCMWRCAGQRKLMGERQYLNSNSIYQS